MKKVFLIVLLVLSLVIALSGCFINYEDVKAVITIKSDAIIELIADERGKIISVAPLNAAGEVVMISLDIINDTVNTAMRKLIMELSKLGYINAVNNDVYVDTLALDYEKTQNYNRTVFNAIKNYNKSINVFSYDFKIEERDHRSFIRNTKGFENLSFLQFRLITNLMRYRSDMTYKLGARMNADELTQELIDNYAFSAQFHSYSLAEWFNKTINAKMLTYGEEISSILGGAIKQNYESFIKLKGVVKQIINDKLTEKLSLDIVAQALNIVGISDVVDVESAYQSMSNNAYGYPIIDSLRQYIDNLYINKVFANDAAKETFEKQIDNAKAYYVINQIKLTEQEKQDIIDILPFSIVYQYQESLNTLEDAYYLLNIIVTMTNNDYKKQYEQSTQELKVDLDKLVNSINNATNDTISEHKQLIDKEYEKLSKENQRRQEIYKK